MWLLFVLWMYPNAWWHSPNYSLLFSKPYCLQNWICFCTFGSIKTGPWKHQLPTIYLSLCWQGYYQVIYDFKSHRCVIQFPVKTHYVCLQVHWTFAKIMRDYAVTHDGITRRKENDYTLDIIAKLSHFKSSHGLFVPDLIDFCNASWCSLSNWTDWLESWLHAVRFSSFIIMYNVELLKWNLSNTAFLYWLGFKNKAYFFCFSRLIKRV